MLSYFRDVTRFGYHHGSALAVVLMPYFVLIAVVRVTSTFMAEQSPLWHGFYLSVLLAVYPLYMGRLIKYMAWVAGPPGETPESLRISATDWRRLFLVNLIITGLVSCGLLLFIIPGLYLAARFAFAEFVTTLRTQLPLAALETSWRETGAHMAVLFQGAFLIMGTSTVLEILVLPSAQASLSMQIALGLVGEGISIAGSLVLAVFFFRIYCLGDSRR